MNIYYARKYVSPRTRALTLEEKETRWISYALKDWTDPAFTLALQAAVAEMVPFIDGPSILIPVPSSKGSTTANRKLAEAIATRAGSAKVVDVLIRSVSVESSCQRHRRNAGPLTIQEHHIIRKPKRWLSLRADTRLYFVDNTATSGNTLAACRAAIGAGEGLVFSDAGLPSFTR